MRVRVSNSRAALARLRCARVRNWSQMVAFGPEIIVEYLPRLSIETFAMNSHPTTHNNPTRVAVTVAIKRDSSKRAANNVAVAGSAIMAFV